MVSHARPAEVVRRWAELDEHAVSRTAKRMFARPMAEIAAMANEATAERVEADLAALPEVTAPACRGSLRGGPHERTRDQRER